MHYISFPFFLFAKGSTLLDIQEYCDAACEDGLTKPLVQELASRSAGAKHKGKNAGRSFRRWFGRIDS